MEAQLKKDYERSDFSEFGGYYLLVSLFDAEKDNIEWMSWHILYYCINVYDVKELDGRKVFVCIYEQWDTDNHAFIGDCKKGRYLFPITRSEARRRLEEIEKFMDSWEFPITIREINIEDAWKGDDYDDDANDEEKISFKIYHCFPSSCISV